MREDVLGVLFVFGEEAAAQVADEVVSATVGVVCGPE
jgi:hypothetical protein